jgi:hypothetical protein
VFRRLADHGSVHLYCFITKISEISEGKIKHAKAGGNSRKNWKKIQKKRYL